MSFAVGRWRRRPCIPIAGAGLLLLVLLVLYVTRRLTSLQLAEDQVNEEQSHQDEAAPPIRQEAQTSRLGLTKRELALAKYLETVKESHSTAADASIKSFQFERQMHVRKACRQHESTGKSWRSLSPLARKTLLSHMLVNDKYRFLYCYTPKVACSNWKKILKVLDEGAIHPNDGVLDHFKDVKFLKHYSDDEIEERLETYYKFTFVREPVSRLVSGFLNKFREIPDFMRKTGVEVIMNYRKNPPKFTKGDDVTFEEFIRYLLDKRPEKLNEHFMPVEHLCQPCVVKFDFIGAYENLQAEANFVIRQVGASHRVAFPSPQRYYRPASHRKVLQLYNTLSAVQKQQLQMLFRMDYEAFNYEPPES